MRVFWIVACTIVVCDICVNAWTESEKCDGHDGDSVNRRDLLQRKEDVPVVPLPPVVQSGNKQTNSYYDAERNLRGRKLGANPTIETMQLKMHWEEDYCWQLEATERK